MGDIPAISSRPPPPLPERPRPPVPAPPPPPPPGGASAPKGGGNSPPVSGGDGLPVQGLPPLDAGGLGAPLPPTSSPPPRADAFQPPSVAVQDLANRLTGGPPPGGQLTRDLSANVAGVTKVNDIPGRFDQEVALLKEVLKSAALPDRPQTRADGHPEAGMEPAPDVHGVAADAHASHPADTNPVHNATESTSLPDAKARVLEQHFGQKVTEAFSAYGDRLLALTQARTAIPVGTESLLAKAEVAKALMKAAGQLVEASEQAIPTPSHEHSAAVEKFFGKLTALGFDRAQLSEAREAVAPVALTDQRATPQSVQQKELAVQGPKSPSAHPLAPDAHGERTFLGLPLLGGQRLPEDPKSPWLAQLRGLTNKRLGPKMLWNVLHRFRGTGEDSAQSKDEWNRLMVLAVLVLTGVVIGVVVLINL